MATAYTDANDENADPASCEAELVDWLLKDVKLGGVRGVVHPMHPKLREILFIMGVIPKRPIPPEPAQPPTQQPASDRPLDRTTNSNADNGAP